MSGKQKIEIDIISDVVCPWCWITKRKMEEAIRRTSDKYEFVIRWRPYLLRPSIPLEGLPESEGNGLPDAAIERSKNIGKTVGLNYTYKVNRVPNTLAAHALLDYALTVDEGKKQTDLKEAIMRGYFELGLYPDATNISKMAKDLGYNEQEAYKVMTDKKNLEKAREEAAEWRSKTESGIPHFYINGQNAFHGIQEPEAFVNMFEKVAKN